MMNAAEIEVLVSYLISQGQTRVRAEQMVLQNPQKVRAQMEKADQEQEKSQAAPIDPALTAGAGQESEVSAEYPQEQKKNW